MIDITKIINERFRVTFNDFFLSKNIPLKEQLDNLKEDLFQAEWENIIIDIGWYPSFNINGKFIVNFIKDGNWGEPIYHFETKEIPILIDKIISEQKNILLKTDMLVNKPKFRF